MSQPTTQTVSAQTAHRLLGELLAAQNVLQWLKDNQLLHTEATVEALTRQYAGQLKQERQFLDQFEL